MRAFVAAALRSRLSALGIALTTASALIFLGLVLLEVVGALHNPYVGIITFVRLVQEKNAQAPMLVTLLGIVTLVRLVHSKNAKSPMLTTG